jgi:hypothetical protein
LTSETGEGFRENFLRNFTLRRYLSGLAQAFLQVEQTRTTVLPGPAASILPR